MIYLYFFCSIPYQAFYGGHAYAKTGSNWMETLLLAVIAGILLLFFLLVLQPMMNRHNPYLHKKQKTPG